MIERKKILWLAGWYPNIIDGYKGDFIQRHARAAAIYSDVFVIHIEKYIGHDAIQDTNAVVDGVTEHLLYLKAKKNFFERITTHRKWLVLYKGAVKEYIAANGLPDVVHVQVPYNAGIIAQWIKRKYNVPYIVTEHYGIYNNEVADPFVKRSFLFKQLTKSIVRDAALFVPVSESLGEAVNKLVLHKKFIVVPNVVDCSIFFYKPVPISKFRFIHVSNMIALKNVEGIIAASKILHLKKICFELILVGPTSSKISEIVKSVGAESYILFTGEIPYKDVAVEIQQSNSLILFRILKTAPVLLARHCVVAYP